MREKAIYRHREDAMIELEFEGGRIVSRKNVGRRYKQVDLNWVYDMDDESLMAYLLDRRIALGRPDRNRRYFGGKKLTPYEELKAYNGADLDDYCWLDYGTGVTFSELFGGVV